MLTIREYKKVESLEEAYTLNQKKSNRVIGGMIWLKMETLNVGTAIDLSGLGLDTIEETETEFRIGAMASLRALELHEGLAAYTNGAMRESVRHIVGVQLRNLATVGGSLYSRFGFSDVLTMFLVLDAQVELYKGGIVPLSEYAERPKDRDILVRIIVPKKNAKFNYQSVRISQTDIPVLTCASVKDENGYRFAVGARPARGADGGSRSGGNQDRQQSARQCGISQTPRGCAGAPRGTRARCRVRGNGYADHNDIEWKESSRRCGGGHAAHRLCAGAWLPERQARLRDRKLRSVHRIYGRKAGAVLLGAGSACKRTYNHDLGGLAGRSRRIRRVHRGSGCGAVRLLQSRLYDERNRAVP